MKNKTEYQLNNNQQALKNIAGLAEDLCRVEEEIMLHIVNADPRGLAAVMACSAEIVARGKELTALMEQEQYFGDKESEIDLQPETKPNGFDETARESIVEMLEAVGQRQQINRLLLSGCMQISRKLQKICPAGSPVYNDCGEIRLPASDGSARLDQGR